MARIITDYLEETCKRYPEKIGFKDEFKSLTFKLFRSNALKIASFIINKHIFKKPVAIYMEKSVDVLVSFMGVAYSGNFYTPIDSEMPLNRIKNIFDTLDPEIIITRKSYFEKINTISSSAEIVFYEDLMETVGDESLALDFQNTIIDTDILYVLFTSGSTGIPKGVIISHKATISYAEWVCSTFNVNSNTVFGNQTPFYFSMSVFDIFATLKIGSMLNIIPKRLFSQPNSLIEYTKKEKINFIYWVPTALAVISSNDNISTDDLELIKDVLFAGEVMHTKQLNKLKKMLPSAYFANLYGPTEFTDICAFYPVNREFSDEESLPIGNSCLNSDVFILDNDNNLIESNNVIAIGEICARGSFIAYGYYNNESKTKECFVQNPLNPAYPEIIYRTGDLGQYNEYGEIIYKGRKDFQIKISGYRIELGEIEAAVSSIPEIQNNCCLYDSNNQLLICIYTGDVDKKQIRGTIKDMLPRYMMPHKYIKLDEMPLNANGKIDRVLLKNKYIEV